MVRRSRSAATKVKLEAPDLRFQTVAAVYDRRQSCNLGIVGGHRPPLQFARPHWGRGFATEAGRSWLAFGFGELVLQRIIAFAHHQNLASIQVLNKLGFSYYGQQRNDSAWSVYEIQAIKPFDST